MKIKILTLMIIVGTVLVAVRAEAANCNFTRDLYQGMYGEDVRCLQQFLGSSQYGSYYSYGYPDGVFGQMTSQAVAQWQVANGLTATGYFDSASRNRYFELLGSYGSVNGAYVGGYGTNYSFGTNTDEQRAYNKIWEALKMIGQAWDEIEDTNRSTSSAEKDLEEAQDDLRDAALEYFVNRDFDEAYDLAVDAFNNADDAFDKVDC